MGNKLGKGVKNSLSCMFDIFKNVRKNVTDLTEQVYDRPHRDESSPLMKETKHQNNYAVGQPEESHLGKTRSKQLVRRQNIHLDGKQSGTQNRVLVCGKVKLNGQNGRFKELCVLKNISLSTNDSDVPPPLPTKKNRHKIRRFGVIYNELESERLSEDLIRDRFPKVFGKKEQTPNRYASVDDENCLKDLSAPHEYEDNKCFTDCKKHTVRRFSLPSLYAGCLLAGTNTDSHTVDIIDFSPKALSVPDYNFETISKPALRSGGTVVYGELSKLISIPNIYAENPIVFSYLPENFKPQPIASTEDLTLKQERKLCRSISGGGLVRDTRNKVPLPYLFSFQEPKTTISFHRTMSGGWIKEYENADHVIFSDLLSQTFRCREISEIQKSKMSEGYSVGPRISYENNSPEYISRMEVFDIENNRKKNNSNIEQIVTAEDKSQSNGTEVSRMVEVILECYNIQNSELRL